MSIIGVDMDGTVVYAMPGHKHHLRPLQLIPGAIDGLRGLKNDGHVLLLATRRANLARRFDPMLNPLIRAGVVPYPDDWDPRMAQARYQQAVDFANNQIPGIFDAVDDGRQGRPDVDYMIDDGAITMRTWQQVVVEIRRMIAQDENSKGPRSHAGTMQGR